MQLAEEIVAGFYSQDQAKKARQEFEKIFSKGDVPADIVEYKIIARNQKIIDILVINNLVSSKSEARRLLLQGGITIDGEKITDEEWLVRAGVLKVGKRRFLQLSF